MLSHIQNLKDTYNIKHFHFEDDNLTLNPKRTRELLKGLTELQITWDTPNGVRADTINEEVAGLMAESGAKSITIAVESGDENILNSVINKRLDLKKVRNAARNLYMADIPTIAFFIIGFPGEDKQAILSTLQFAKNLTIDYGTLNLLFVATPLVGTPLYQQCMDEELLVAPLNNTTLLSAIRLNQTPLIQTPEFTKADLLKWTKIELETPDIICKGSTVPIFWSNKNGERMARKLFGNTTDGSAYNFQMTGNIDASCSIPVMAKPT
ncbi:B12-binding domain-containing radical SAM protein [Polycladidibacter stylochi]|uniref:B12-binding domain-containing radical SAM protein n=1 Tax=Polycladidibacter stylochi TaxID=1807766 RepID=UPI000833F0E3|nr:radical SAM protein [Pseudovibrio stylochi]